MLSMKKSALAVAVTLGLGVGAAQAAPVSWTGTFDMYSGAGGQLDANDAAPGVSADVTGVIDTGAGTFTLASTNTFFGTLWSTSGGTLYGPGTYTHSTVDPGCGPTVACGGSYTFTVGAGQVGATVDFAWGATTGIDVLMVWNVSGNSYTMTDPDGDGIPGTGMIDGPFPSFNANFNMTAVPVPAAVWLFGSGLLGLVGIARRKKKA